MGDVDNLSVPKLHHHQPFSSQPPAGEFDVATTGVGFGIVDPVLEFEPLGGISVTATPSTASLPHSGVLYQSNKNNRFTGSSQLLYQNSRQGRKYKQVAMKRNSLSPALFFSCPAFNKPSSLSFLLFGAVIKLILSS
ncbi:hypothetical protein KSP40_PGU013714 [Platanthera guangdongensis]|uniref:Uncharacterized protein n=1 Tax=Platanthera guangdongensis TaxID=2320717 RepID=A0ABR2MNJ5_9ASPA